MSIVIVYTGNGKGKTTAALGMALRAVAYNYKVCMIQFIKGSWKYGEMKSYERLKPEFEMIIAGKGFVGIIDDDKPIDEHKLAAMNALKISIEKVSSGNYDIVILDEINYAIKLGLIEEDDVISMINNRAKNTSIVLTGNYASSKLIEIADLVTEMKEIKHPYKKGIKAIKGIDY
ncbi:MAG: cob(I)alamin adenosyltransferase [Candidatus Nitrosocaldaceae archaeon]|nr:MAG: cob(I)alamin adenosyltransferase [Candidatus Nitrosocaldaceae archaeon]